MSTEQGRLILMVMAVEEKMQHMGLGTVDPVVVRQVGKTKAKDRFSRQENTPAGFLPQSNLVELYE